MTDNELLIEAMQKNAERYRRLRHKMTCGSFTAAEELAVMIAADNARREQAPCMECGANDPKEAETMCRCSGDKDDCHGCELWPDAA